MAITVNFGRAGVINLGDNRNINEFDISKDSIDDIIYVEASDIYLDCICGIFTAVNRNGCSVFTIPVSTAESQRWYGDTAKTIIYALLQ